MTLRTLNYGNYGIFLIMGHAGFCPSTVWLLSRQGPARHPFPFLRRARAQKLGDVPSSGWLAISCLLFADRFRVYGLRLFVWCVLEARGKQHPVPRGESRIHDPGREDQRLNLQEAQAKPEEGSRKNMTSGR